jgi:hypothetical protein
LAVGATTAVGAYAVGVTARVVGLGRCGAGWCRRTSMVAACEVVLLAGVAAGWLASGVHPGRITSPITTDRLLTGVPSALRGAAIIAIHNRECSVLPWPATARIYR